jgi:DNA-binding transcriptional regulator YiaG
MPNIALVLKDVIRRVAKREVKALTGTMKQAVAKHRRDLAELKRHTRSQEKEIAFLRLQERKRLDEPPAKPPSERARFSPRSVKAQRRRLKLSAADYGKLVGVSGLTVYHWEHGKSRPRKAQLAALVAVRGIGRREALAKLALAKGRAGKSRPKRRRKA